MIRKLRLGTWAVSTALLTQDAVHLFNLSAFFSPEPIAAELLIQQPAVLDDPPGVREFLSSATRFRAAASQLHRLSLAKVDGARDLIQMHRVVQAVTRGRLHQDHSDLHLAYRSAVDALLAASNPGSPDLASNDAAFDLSLQHLESDPTFCTPTIPRFAASSSTRYGGCGFAAPTWRRCASAKTPSTCGARGSAMITSTC